MLTNKAAFSLNIRRLTRWFVRLSAKESYE